MKLRFFLFISFVILVILSLEIALRWDGRLQTYSEKNFNTYQSAYDSGNQKHLLVWEKNNTHSSVQKEFEFEYSTNQYGLIDLHLLDTCSKENTIIYLGDSFTFGVGSSQKENIPYFLEEQLNRNIINAGIPGSDPFYQANLIDSVFTPLGFDKFIFMLNFSDIYDYVIRGGTERFLNNNKVRFRKAPWVEPFYQKSYIIRAFVHKILKMDFSLLSQSKMKELKHQSITEYAQLFTKINKKHDIIVVLQPYARQYAETDNVLTEVLNFEYLEILDSTLSANNIETINLNQELKKAITPSNYLEYSWDLDGHYNARGYAMISDILANELTLNHSEFIK